MDPGAAVILLCVCKRSICVRIMDANNDCK